MLGVLGFVAAITAQVNSASQTAPATVMVGVDPAVVTPSESVPSVTPVTPVDPAIDVVPVGEPRTLTYDPAWKDVQPDVTHPRGTFPARLVNLSVRAPIGPDAATIMVGAGIDGSGQLPVLVRAIGPGLANYGVTGCLRAAPDLTLYDGTRLLADANTVTAAAATAASYIRTFAARPPSGGDATGDAALVGMPSAGILSAHCTSSETSRVAMLEMYDVDPNASATSAHFINFSGRGIADAGERTLVVGFSIAGDGEVSVLLRGVGATLNQFGLTNVLNNPAITLYSGATIIATNDDWQSGSASMTAAIREAADHAGAFPLTNATDAALLMTLPAGTYTLHVRSATSGAAPAVVLGEVYQVNVRPPAADPTETFDAALSTNALGFDVYRRLASPGSPSNLIISPYSLETAFSLAYVGAAGDTRTEMARVLRLPDDNTAVAAGFAELDGALAAMAQQSIATAAARSINGAHFDPIQWAVANRIFGQNEFPFRDSYLSLLNDGFAAPLNSVDFIGNAEGVRQTINAWVAGMTHDRIIDLIPQNGIGSDTRFTLVNALYVKAPWNQPFGKALTESKPFYFADGTSANVPTMQQTGSFGYAEENGLTIVGLDYIGGDLQMLVLLPKPGESVDALAQRLTAADFSRWATVSRQNDIALSFPKFTVNGPTLALNDVFVALGMGSAFSPGRADFDGIAPRSLGLFLQVVFHKTFVAVDEEGTEAAAATALAGGVTFVPPPPLPVIIDRPFLFAIQQRTTGVCLFLGRITDPR
jgi:serpin B